MKFTCEVCEYDDVTVVFCAGKIVFREQGLTLAEHIRGLFRQGRYVVLELSGVETLDSAGLGELVLLLMYAHEAEAVIKLAAPRKNIRELLELTNLVSIFEVHPTLLDAMLAFQGQAA